MSEEPYAYAVEVFEFRTTLTGETDRGCALMAAAYLDDQLERLIRRTLIDDTAAIDDLLRSSGAVGSFSARIELCYALGCLPIQARRELHLIRKIRNEFGHVAKPLTFEASQISSRCRELQYSAAEAQAPARPRFTSSVLGVCALIHVAIHRATRREVPSDTTRTEEEKARVREQAFKLLLEVLSDDPTSDIPDVNDTDPIETRLLNFYRKRVKQLNS
jgi:DNA-binding MltR family transcriptional regulator